MQEIVTVPKGLLYFIAFSMILYSARYSKISFPTISSSISSMLTSILIPLFDAMTFKSSTTSSRITETLTRSFKGSFSCLMISSNVSIIPFIFKTDFSITSIVVLYSSILVSSLLFNTSILVLITANGVFSSCATLELNLFCEANAFSNLASILLNEMANS